jgi:hypothetical protein
MSDSSNTKKGLACTVLFLMPFMIAGVFILGSGILAFIKEPKFTEDIIARFGVGTMFTAISLGFLALVLLGARKEKEEDHLKKENPTSPWLWKEEWHDGKISSSAPTAAIILWIMGLVFTAIPILSGLKEAVQETPAAYLVLLFPLVGLGMLGGAIHSTIAWYKFGKVHCEMITHPGVIGGWCKAIIWANIQFTQNETITAQLTCFHRHITGSGKNRSVQRDVQWQEDIDIEMQRVTKVPAGQTAIPIMVYIPRDCMQTTLQDPDDRIEWELSAKAEITGVDFAANFIVPVFVTSQSTDTPPLNEHGEHLDEIIKPYTPTIAVRDNVDGGFSLYAPPRRNISMMFGLTIFFVIWTIIVGVLFTVDDLPWLFPIVFGGFDIFIGWGVLWTWFGKSWLDISKNEITITKKLLGIGKAKNINIATIIDIQPHINMRSGNTPFYAIRFKINQHGGKDTIGGLKSKDEAEGLCKRIRQAINL